MSSPVNTPALVPPTDSSRANGWIAVAAILSAVTAAVFSILNYFEDRATRDIAEVALETRSVLGISVDGTRVEVAVSGDLANAGDVPINGCQGNLVFRDGDGRLLTDDISYVVPHTFSVPVAESIHFDYGNLTYTLGRESPDGRLMIDLWFACRTRGRSSNHLLYLGPGAELDSFSSYEDCPIDDIDREAFDDEGELISSGSCPT
jgi:hypothetical protein